MFTRDEDYAAFAQILREADQRHPTRLLGYCLMPNHWHLILWPHRDGDLSRLVGWLTLTHTQRWHARNRTAGSGHLYQGRFKSFPIQEDTPLLRVLRYVEGNASRAGLVQRAEQWRWSSLIRRQHASGDREPRLDAGPVALPANWTDQVNEPLTEAELAAVRRSVTRGQPFGEGAWVAETAAALNLQLTLRPRGRPRKTNHGS